MLPSRALLGSSSWMRLQLLLMTSVSPPHVAVTLIWYVFVARQQQLNEATTAAHDVSKSSSCCCDSDVTLVMVMMVCDSNVTMVMEMMVCVCHSAAAAAG